MTLSGLAAGLLLTAAALVWGTVRIWRRGRYGGAGLTGLAAVLTALVGGVAMGMAAGFTAIDRLTDETAVGTIEFSLLDSGAYMARVSLEGGDPLHYRLAGDHWQLDVRFVKWQLPATLMGAGRLFQLDRLSGRYADVSALREAEITAYSLAGEPGRSMWSLISRSEAWIPWLDAVYGNAVYLPMTHGARYRISVAGSGLVARPDNPAAQQATRAW